MRFGFRRQDALFLVVSAALVTLYAAAAGGGFPLDDSWIHQTYGRNLAQYGEWAFIPGVPSAASTSPLYTVLLAPGYKLGIPYLVWTHALGALALAAAGMVGARLAALGVRQFSLRLKWVDMLTGLVLILAWHLIWAAASGMETMLFSTLTLVLIWLAWRELADHSRQVRSLVLRGTLFGALSALMTLARPEGLMLVGMIGLMMLVVRPQGPWRAFLFWSGGVCVGFSVLITPYLLLNLALTGGLLPNTAAAKQAQNAQIIASFSYLRRFGEMVKPLIAGGQILLLPGMIYFLVMVARRIRRDRTALFSLLPLLWGLGLIALYAARLPAPYQHGRYVIPTIPSFIVMGVVGMAALLQRGQVSLIGRVLTRALAIAAGLAFAYFAFVVGPPVYRTDVRIIEEEMVTAAHWIADHIPPQDLLAVHDIGAVGYFAPRPILDLAGLVSPEVIPFISDPEPLWRWLREHNARYLMAFPDQLPGDDPDDPRLCEVYITNGATSRSVGGPNMAVYALTWNGICPR